ncbi:MAG: hypothetical protein NAG76_21280 [Candidatus Pristimantibacillus lignocellulolyticus]|uniref:Uncharacterized protein n=1 Tax=Candidatus Pristimantibacillus lignocellulolyticus TaxID=2994561 RepID=A0A9J6ZDT8_9BACL|nr:MAG: hypothetical protein NAG76_21280 [Candidatus Pristimantibacillus lignocellulolyticus]
MDIVEFIQNNFIFVIGALFFIYKLFSGSKSEKGNSMPTFGGGTNQTNRNQDERDDEDDYEQPEYDDSLEQRRRAELQRLQEEEMHRERQMQRADQLREEQKMRYEQQQRLQQAARTLQTGRDDLSTDYFAQNELGRESKAKQPVDPFAAPEDKDKRKHSELTADELRKAVLWSEVLSSPRAKRPFRR